MSQEALRTEQNDLVLEKKQVLGLILTVSLLLNQDLYHFIESSEFITI